MAWPQKEMARGVSCTLSPTQDLNHWRSRSTSDISTIGEPNRRCAVRVTRSKASSFGVHNSNMRRSDSTRAESLSGIGAGSMAPPRTVEEDLANVVKSARPAAGLQSYPVFGSPLDLPEPVGGLHSAPAYPDTLLIGPWSWRFKRSCGYGEVQLRSRANRACKSKFFERTSVSFHRYRDACASRLSRFRAHRWTVLFWLSLPDIGLGTANPEQVDPVSPIGPNSSKRLMVAVRSPEGSDSARVAAHPQPLDARAAASNRTTFPDSPTRTRSSRRTTARSATRSMCPSATSNQQQQSTGPSSVCPIVTTGVC